MKQKVIVLLLLIIFFTCTAFIWWIQSVKPILSDSSETTEFTITRGESVRSIADRLAKDELIRSPVAFFLWSRFAGVGERMQSGDFRLAPSMDLFAIAETLTHGTADIRITIPEGWRREEIALILTKQLNIPESQFLKIAREGYLFPDTYHFPKDASAAAVVDVFFQNFQKKVTGEIIAKAQSKRLTQEQLITIASMVEREAKLTEDRPLIASVILNRLTINMKLDIDATVQYALGYQPEEKTWWKKALTREDLEVDSPYNTYLVAGLPPTPISNPGIAAITAVVEAPQTEYLYYIADATGKSHFAETFEEHQQNISTYL